MNTTSLVDVDFKDEESLRDFLDANAMAHETIFNTLLASGIVISHYPMFTAEGGDQDWLLIHAQEHRAWSVALNIASPPDIDTLDFENEDMRLDWINNHSDHHDLVAQTLGL